MKNNVSKTALDKRRGKVLLRLPKPLGVSGNLYLLSVATNRTRASSDVHGNDVQWHTQPLGTMNMRQGKGVGDNNISNERLLATNSVLSCF